MDASTVINIILCVLSFVLAAISVVIVVITLRQNSKMLEESTRPVISVYTQVINPGVPMLYLVVKNFGNSTAYMTKFETDFDFTDCYKFHGSRNYIEDFNHCVIAPGQSRICILDYDKLTKPVNFSISYKSSVRTYNEEFCVDLRAASELPTSKYATVGKELMSISYSLQEMLLKNL